MAFRLLLLIAVENELPSMTSAVGFIGTRRSTRFAILGLIVGAPLKTPSFMQKARRTWTIGPKRSKTIGKKRLFMSFLELFMASAAF